jgi:hypothetical protein
MNFTLFISILILISLIYTSIYFVYYYIKNDVNIKNHYKTKGLYGLILTLILILSLYIFKYNIGYVLIKFLDRKLQNYS